MSYYSTILQFLNIYIVLTVIVYIVHLLYQKWTTNDGSKNAKLINVCLVIAHPDDECMFFGPTLINMSKSCNIYILCLTKGDYYNIGDERIKELKSSCNTLLAMNSLKDICIIDKPNQLPDHPSQQWDTKLCSQIIKDYILENKIDKVITFDKNGISKHPNHCTLYLCLKTIQGTVEFDSYSLITTNVLRKYIFLFDLLPTLIGLIIRKLLFKRNDILFSLNSPKDFVTNFNSMRKHKTQLLWFRWIYMVTSRYMIINHLQKI
jgi:N-acetylglucosaminylphosphatidylinositol deacetylase